MKEKILGIISFSGSVFIIFFILHLLIYDSSKPRPNEITILIAIIICLLCTIFYVSITRFGKVKFTELKKIQYENNILKSQIE